MNNLKNVTFLVLASLMLGKSAMASYHDSFEYGDVVDEEKKAYYDLPNVNFSFQNAPLVEVVNLLAIASGMNYQMDPIDLPSVSTNARMNPFKALELITERNGLTLQKNDSMWFISKADENKLIEKTYPLKHVHLAAFEQNLDVSHGHAEEHEYFEGGGSTTNSLHGTKTPVRQEDARIHFVERIREILNLNSGAEKTKLSASGSFVAYDSDTNSLYVIASNKQHRWVSQYLESLDKDIPNIEMKIMFIASNESPERQLGVDWSGTLGDGYCVNLAGNNNSDISFGSLGSLSLPSTAILRTEAFNLKIRGFESCSKNQTKKYPVLTGYSNREVILSFTKNEPIISTTSDTQVQTSNDSIGTGTTNTAQISQEEVGTVVKLLPRVVQGCKIALDIDIGVSNILGFKKLNNNDYPIISQTRYQGQTTVESGYTLVIGGLEETIKENTSHGVPFLKDLPFFGWMFKDIQNGHKKQKLSMYISVKLLNAKGQEVFPKSNEDMDKSLKNALTRLETEVRAIENSFKEDNV